ncbi:MAG: tetraacyldisaccharide 4'-kinase [SAR324 cluster bacterium]|nr:tetraacyldisaccharide 4'-kinase [SAR324 cluster bacterium]
MVYEALVLLRLTLYQKGIIFTKKSSTPIISVGNLTVGGSGKTPMVDFLVKELSKLGKTSSILSRGYGNQTQSSLQRICASEALPTGPISLGDEPYLLASMNPNVPVYVGRDRTIAAQLATILDSPDILILDDGYQYLKLHRQLNLLLIDVERGLGNGYLLPLGQLREPEHHWERADAIILTKSNLGFADRLLHQLHTQLNITCPVFKFDYKPLRLTRLDKQVSISLENLREKQVLLSCGVAQPDGFATALNQLGAEVVDLIRFDDHYPYSETAVTKLLLQKKKIEPDIWITTEKDAVKLKQFPQLATEVWTLEMQVLPDSTWQEFFVDFLNKMKLD